MKRLTSLLLALCLTLALLPVPAAAAEGAGQRYIRVWSTLTEQRHDLPVLERDGIWYAELFALLEPFRGTAKTWTQGVGLKPLTAEGVSAQGWDRLVLNSAVTGQGLSGTPEGAWQTLNKENVSMAAPRLEEGRIWLELLPALNGMGAAVTLREEDRGLQLRVTEYSLGALKELAGQIFTPSNGIMIPWDYGKKQTAGLLLDVVFECFAGELDHVLAGDYDEMKLKEALILMMQQEPPKQSVLKEGWDYLDLLCGIVESDAGIFLLDEFSDGYLLFAAEMGQSAEVMAAAEESAKVTGTYRSGVELLTDVYTGMLRLTQMAYDNVDALKVVFRDHEELVPDKITAMGIQGPKEVAQKVVEQYHDGVSLENLGRLVAENLGLHMLKMFQVEGMDSYEMTKLASKLAALAAKSTSKEVQAYLLDIELGIKLAQLWTGYEFGGLKEAVTLHEIQRLLDRMPIDGDGTGFENLYDHARYIYSVCRLAVLAKIAAHGQLTYTADELNDRLLLMTPELVAYSTCNGLRALTTVKPEELEPLVFAKAGFSISPWDLAKELGYETIRKDGSTFSMNSSGGVYDLDGDGEPEFIMFFNDSRLHADNEYAVVVLDPNNGMLYQSKPIMKTVIQPQLYYDPVTGQRLLYGADGSTETYQRWNGSNFETAASRQDGKPVNGRWQKGTYYYIYEKGVYSGDNLVTAEEFNAFETRLQVGFGTKMPEISSDSLIKYQVLMEGLRDSLAAIRKKDPPAKDSMFVPQYITLGLGSDLSINGMEVQFGPSGGLMRNYDYDMATGKLTGYILGGGW